MKTWRERSVGKGVKRPKSKNMEGIKYQKETFDRIKKQKQKQRKLYGRLEKETRQLKQYNISLEGLERLSYSSIKSLQIKQLRSIQKIVRITKEFSIVTNSLQKLENSYIKAKN